MSPLCRTFLLLIALVGMWLSLPANAAEWGKFSGPVRVEFDRNGRTMTLLEMFIYTDPDGKIWGAPQGTVIDGASIPRPFWAVVSGPFEGKYREASVIHDFACAERTRSWKEVHLAFYNAMRCGGFGEVESKILYYAVYHFGPRWGVGVAINGLFFAPPVVDAEDANQVARWIKTNNPDLNEIANAKKQSVTLPTR